ncbi:MAG: GspE/PulE family protein [Fimbriimonas sp.]
MALTARFQGRTTGFLGQLLIDAAVIDSDKVALALERQRRTGEFLGEALVQSGIITLAELKPHLEKVTGFTVVDIAAQEIDTAIAGLVPESFAASRKVLPFAQENGRVLLAMADPLNVATIDETKALLGRPVEPRLALTKDLVEATRRAYDLNQKTRSVLEEIGIEDHGLDDGLAELLRQTDDAPLVRLVNGIMSGAFAAHASDVHIEPAEDIVRVRYRIDGILYEQMTLPLNHLAPCISRMKVMAGLDIAEKRRPQDGRFSSKDEHGQEYDIRLSIMPTVYGEKACMRLLEKSASLPELEDLGLYPDQMFILEKLVKAPHGLILVTGPTGSGKTTTLYSALQRISNPGLNINTIEDPVEYRLRGANQVQVNPKIGLTFASGLRTLVRQDPDVILVGEIRDKETAEVAVQASLTGHLVLSTLHTNDAPSALVRLRNMGIEPYLISSAVTGLVGQRLLRTVCKHCVQQEDMSIEFMDAFDIPSVNGVVPKVAKTVGCWRCGGRGTRGRAAAFEVTPMSEELRAMVVRGDAASHLMRQAREEGMATMRESAIRKLLDLSTTPEEVLRVFASDE